MNNFRPCPSCPDGYVWNRDGQTPRTCPTCKGFAVVHMDGTPLNKPEQKEYLRDEPVESDRDS